MTTPMAIETLENVPVMETVVSNKTSTFDFFSFTYMTNVPCFIYTYRNLLKLSDIRKRLSHDKPVLQVTPPTMIPNISEQNTGLKLVPTKRKHLVSSETLQKQAKAAKSQQVLTLYIFASFIYILFYIYLLAVVTLLQQY